MIPGIVVRALQTPVDAIVGQVQDTAASPTAADTATDVFSTLGDEVSSAGRLLFEGDWGGLLALLADGFVRATASMLPRLLSATFVAVALYVLYRIALGAVDRLLKRGRRVSRGAHTMVVKTLRVLGIGFIALVALSQLGLNVSAVIAGLGIAGLAVGFAAQESLANFIAGVTILLDRPFQVGDWVKVGETDGRVRDLSLRSTRIETRNREVVVIPNEQMVNQAVINQSAHLPLRVDIPFGVAYKEDIDETRKVVLGTVRGDDRLEADPGSDVVVTALNNSSVDMLLRVHIRDASLAVPLRFEYTEKIRKALGKADIEIPFPHLQLFIDEAKGLEGLRLGRDGG